MTSCGSCYCNCSTGGAFSSAASFFDLALIEGVDHLSVEKALIFVPLELDDLALEDLALLQLLILERLDRQQMLEQVVQEDEGVELQVGIISRVNFEGLLHALNHQLGDVQAVGAYEIYLHHFILVALVTTSAAVG